MGQVPEDQNCESRASAEPGRRRAVSWFLLIVVALAVGIFAWFRQQEQLLAAEVAAKSELQQLGGFVLSGEGGKHVGSVNLSLVRDQKKFDRALELVSDLHWLQVLDLTGRQVSAEQLERLANLRHITSLHLANTGINDTATSALPEFRALEALYLGRNDLTSQSLKNIGRISTLEVLDLSNTKIQGDLAPLNQLTGLQWLVLRDLSLEDASLDTLSEMSSLGRLTLNEGQITEEQYASLQRKCAGLLVDGMDAEDAEHY